MTHEPTPASPAPAPAGADRREALLHELSGLTLPMMWTLRTAARRALEPLGLRPVKGLVLGLIVEGDTTPKELAELLDTPPPMMSSLLADLEERGLIERAPDPDDRRRVRVTATEEGRALAGRIADFWIEAGRERLQHLSDDDLAHMVRVYRAIVEAS